MKTNKHNLFSKKSAFAFVLVAFQCLSPFLAQAQNPTPDYWRCENRVGGSWVFGQAPMACDASTFGDEQFLQRHFNAIVFSDLVGASGERSRYMPLLHATLRDIGAAYFERRKPEASAAEKAAWLRAVYAVAHQESFWTHYRKATDGRLKLMRGDFGHGHGLMQVDDRWHFAAINDGTAWNVVRNTVYSLEQYFAGWQRFPNVSCFTRADDYDSRARAAYSAYNGGPSRICRWTNPNDTWARNDNGFRDKLRGAQWISFVGDGLATAPVDVRCHMNNGENCPPGAPPAPTPTPTPTPTPPAPPAPPVSIIRNPENLYVSEKNQTCVLNRQGKISCLPNFRDSVCLNLRDEANRTVVERIAHSAMPTSTGTVLDRHALCGVEATGLASVGTVLQLKKSIWLRASPAGNSVVVAPAGALVQVEDFEVRNFAVVDRYYKVRWQGKVGYFYGGTSNDHQSWASSVPSFSMKQRLIADIDDRVQITSTSGINMREIVGGRVLTIVPRGTLVSVLERRVVGETNDIYYRVSYAGTVGWIYSGMLLAEPSVTSWTIVSGN